MVIPAAGDIIVVPFPFTDLSTSKIRPAIVLANAGRDDWILCQVTSNAYSDIAAIEISRNDFASGGLRVTSYARPGKLFTAHESLFKSRQGKLKPEKLQEVKAAVAKLFI
ncbi:MAG: type II toxin-antitoxin system PemK/MazF family toxin [Caldilineaceae bacterium]